VELPQLKSLISSRCSDELDAQPRRVPVDFDSSRKGGSPIGLRSGIYVLALQVNANMRTSVGSLGVVRFDKGVYAYVGSAQIGLAKRIERHLRMKKKKFWHIDSLLDDGRVSVMRVFYKVAAKREECRTAQTLGKYGVIVAGFGCSDCDCASHLIMFKSIDQLSNSLNALSPQDAAWSVYISTVSGIR
jgi:Uri superfamily endonuclease